MESKIQNPIFIKLGKDNLILPDDVTNYESPLDPGALFGGEHYGFVLIVDHNNKQEEFIYPTENRVSAAGIYENVLNIFEEGKRLPWKFSKSGKLKYSISQEPIDKLLNKYNILSENIFRTKGKLKNPLQIKILLDDPDRKSYVMKDRLIKEDYPLFPGVVLGNDHYGFIIYTQTNDGCSKKTYLTENKINAIGIEGNEYSDIKIYEEGKYCPWIFSNQGALKQQAQYNPYSRRDMKYMDNVYQLDDSAERNIIKR